MRRLLSLAAVALLVVLGMWLLWPRAEQNPAPSVRTATTPAGSSQPATTSLPSVSSTARPEPSTEAQEARITLADPLNAPDGDIHRDLRALQDIFIAWITNFPHDGNPVGENVEITAALTGENSLRLALIPKDHRAINAQGELCDRWGTPFRFHQLSGTRMEIRSAGPDRKFGTADDALLTP